MELDFDGYGIGGLSVGEPRPAMLEALAATVPHLPADRPRYLMGVGDPVGHDGGGRPRGRPVRLRGPHPDGPARLHADQQPVASTCATPSTPATTAPSTPAVGCLTCARWSRGYLRHLLGVGEPTAWRLLSIHNLAFVLGLMAEARAAIAEGRFDAAAGPARREVWGRPEVGGASVRVGLGYSRTAVRTPIPFPDPR